MTPEQKSEIIRLRLEGCSWGVIAERVEVSRYAVAGVLDRAGIKYHGEPTQRLTHGRMGGRPAGTKQSAETCKRIGKTQKENMTPERRKRLSEAKRRWWAEWRAKKKGTQG